MGSPRASTFFYYIIWAYDESVATLAETQTNMRLEGLQALPLFSE